MVLTGKQAYVLENLDRVQPLLYKLEVQYPVRRFQLDGWECTSQITGLVVKNLVQEQNDALQRKRPEPPYSIRV